MSSLQNDLQFSSSFQRDQGQFLQFQCAPGVEYDFFNTPPSPEPLVPSHGSLPDFHTPTFYAFSATPSPTFEESLGLPSFPVSEATSTLSTFKSPSRLRSGNRVPRPRNAFMIFRSEFWAGEKISRSVEHDHRHISRIIGHCWNQLPDSEKDKWREKAEQEKLDHIMKYPGYRFSPNARTKKAVKRKVKRNSEEELLRCKQVAELLLAGKQGVELDSAVKGMKSPLDDTVLKDRGKGSDNGGSSRRPRMSSPKNGEPRRKSNSPTLESSGHRPALDHIDIPIFRSPLLPPAQTQQNISPTHHQSLSSFQYVAALGSYGPDGIASQQYLSSPAFDLSSSDNLCQGGDSQQVPAYFHRPDGYSLSTGGADTTQQQSEGHMCLPYLQYHYESTPDGFYGLSSSSTAQTASVLGTDPSAYSTSPQAAVDPLMWDFSGLGTS